MVTLITGAPGWLGSRFVEVLCQGWRGEGAIDERKVRCLVLPEIDISDLQKLRVEIVRGDVRDIESLKEAVKNVETVFHLVGLIHPRRIRELYDINTEGTRNMISAVVEAGVRRFIYVSSNSPAGHNTGWGRPMVEEDKPKPYKHYGKSKYLAEQIVNEFYQLGKIETVIIRPCWYYGPGQPARQTRFFRMIKSGKPIIFGSGNNLRSMSYIDNVVQGLLLAEKCERANGQTYWITDERPYATIEIYETVAKLLGVELKPRFVPRFTSKVCEWIDTMIQAFGFYSTNFHVAGEMAKDIYCSIEKAKEEIGYQPNVSLEEGMRRSIEWCRSKGIEI